MHTTESIQSLFSIMVDFIDKIMSSDKWKHQMLSSYPLLFFENIAALEQARNQYYAHDEESCNVFDWR